jgi:hypothetical protein
VTSVNDKSKTIIYHGNPKHLQEAQVLLKFSISLLLLPIPISFS